MLGQAWPHASIIGVHNELNLHAKNNKDPHTNSGDTADTWTFYQEYYQDTSVNE